MGNTVFYPSSVSKDSRLTTSINSDSVKRFYFHMLHMSTKSLKRDPIMSFTI